MKVTLQDVARQAGVSVSTVSNALNGRRSVNSTTRERIQSIARELGYSLNRQQEEDVYIRLVIYKRSGQIVMDTDFFTDMFNAIVEECQVNQIGLMVTTIHLENDTDVRRKIRDLSQENCTGLLILATEMKEEDLMPFLSGSSALIALDSEFPFLPVSTISTDNYQAGRLAALHLLEKGHRQVGYLDSSVSSHNGIGRKQGFLDTMESAGFPVSPESIWAVQPTPEGAFRDLSQILSIQGRPVFSACFAYNDLVAYAAARAFRLFSIDIPHDVSVIGMDDMQLCRVGNPAISTILVRRRLMARTAVRRLMEMSRDVRSRGVLRTRVGVQLIERGSVKDLLSAETSSYSI